MEVCKVSTISKFIPDIIEKYLRAWLKEVFYWFFTGYTMSLIK